MGETPQPDEKQVQPKYNSIIWIQFKSGGCTLGGVGGGGGGREVCLLSFKKLEVTPSFQNIVVLCTSPLPAFFHKTFFKTSKARGAFYFRFLRTFFV